jgi:adenylosuccinate synthase
LTKLSSYDEAPKALKEYVLYLEKMLEIPITVVSVGPDRKQTLVNRKQTLVNN